MKQIRYGVFETNSSSMHSVTIHSYDKDDDTSLEFDELENKVVGHFNEFGWGYETYDDANSKLSYLLTMIGERCQTIEALYNSEDFKQIEECVTNRIPCDGIMIPEEDYRNAEYSDGELYLDMNGYVDHQSMFPTIGSFLVEYNLDLDEFIFNRNITLVIDNDNH